MITLNSISHTYPGESEAALRDVSLTLGDATVTALVGPNGSGKTTVMQIYGGVMVPTSGGGEEKNTPPPLLGGGGQEPSPPRGRESAGAASAAAPAVSAAVVCKSDFPYRLSRSLSALLYLPLRNKCWSASCEEYPVPQPQY